MILTLDILPYICQHIADLHSLGRLCCVDSICRFYLIEEDSGAGKHWMRVGRKMCGFEYWDTKHHEEGHGRYTTMLHVCPWMAAPVVFSLTTLEAYENLYASVELLGMRVIDDEDCVSKESKIIILANVQENDHVKGGRRVIHRHAREHDNTDLIYPPDEEQFHEVYDQRETSILNEIKADENFINITKRYGLGELTCIRIVHQNLFAAIFAEGRSWRYTTVLFIDMKDWGNIIHELKLLDCSPHCVVFKPSEMWYATSGGNLCYYGPNKKRNMKWTSRGSGRITRAFFQTICGNVTEALEILKPLSLDLMKVRIPTTKYTLFDVAADPWGSNKINEPLPYDATMLLEMEPRFANSIYMVRRAISAMDMEWLVEIRNSMGIEYLWLSANDITAALPEGMEQKVGFDLLRSNGILPVFTY